MAPTGFAHRPIDDLIDHMHSPSLRVTWHLPWCRRCRADLRLLRTVADALRGESEVSEELIERTLEAVFADGAG